MRRGDCAMCHARDAEVQHCRIELAVAYAQDLAREFDVFPATSLIDFDGDVCPPCAQVARDTSAFFFRKIEEYSRGVHEDHDHGDEDRSW